MYSYLAMFVLAAALGALIHVRYRRRLPLHKRIALYMGLAAASVLGGHVTGCLIGAVAPWRYELVSSIPLAALRTAEGPAGTFVLGSGRIDQEMTYVVYVRNDDGSVTPHRIKANQSVKIFQDPQLVNQGFWKSFRRVVDKDWWLRGFALCKPTSQDYLIHLVVPNGAVVEQFSLR